MCRRTRPRTAQALCRTYDVALLDLDGVVYRGPEAIPRAVMCIRAAVDAGMRTAYVTNNAARPPAEVAAHLAELGLAVAAGDVVTSAQAGARVLRERLGVDKRVLAVGGPGVEAALREEGLQPARRAAGRGRHRRCRSRHDRLRPRRQLAGPGRRELRVAGGAAFVATNTDLTIPTRSGIGPGNGAMVAAVTAATGVSPRSRESPSARCCPRRSSAPAAQLPLVIGDRLDTDIEAAVRLDLPSLLVLTGVTDVAALLEAPPERRPTYLSADLRGLLARGRRLTGRSGCPRDGRRCARAGSRD